MVRAVWVVVMAMLAGSCGAPVDNSIVATNFTILIHCVSPTNATCDEVSSKI